MKKMYLIGMTGDYACNASILVNNITDQLTEPEVELYLDKGRLGLLNASLSNIVQRIWKIKKAMLAGVFDDWHEQYKTLGPNGRYKDYMIMNELVLLWPFVCSCSLFKTLYIDGELDSVFKGLPLKVSAIWLRHYTLIPARIHYSMKGIGHCDGGLDPFTNSQTIPYEEIIKLIAFLLFTFHPHNY